MLNHNQEHKINLVRKTHNIDKIRREKINLQKKGNFLRFSAFLKQKHLGEVTVIDDVADTMLATLPINATQADIDDVIRAISIMTQVGSVVVTAVAVTPDS
jgi:hypothetical protein